MLGALAGLRRKRREVGLLVLFASVYLVTLVIFYVADRYRIVVLPALLALSALGLVELSALMRASSPRRRAAALLVILGAFALGHLPLTQPPSGQRLLYDLHNLTGKAWGDRGEMAKAEASFREAVATAGEGKGAVARTNLGLILERRQDWAAARRLYEQAAAADPEYRAPRSQLARLCERRGEIGEAIHWWEEVVRLEADPAPIREHIQQLRASLR